MTTRKKDNQHLVFHINDTHAVLFFHNTKTDTWTPNIFRIVTPTRMPCGLPDNRTYDLSAYIGPNMVEYLEFVWGGGSYTLKNACVKLWLALEYYQLDQLDPPDPLPEYVQRGVRISEDRWRKWHGFSGN